MKFYFNGIGCAFPGYYGKFGAAAENVLGWGGVPDNPEVRAFYKLHKEVTGVDADFNGNPLYYANNQLLTQAIEGAGSMDREAIAAHIKSHTYKTLLGEFDMRNQLLNRLYTVGQWHNALVPRGRRCRLSRLRLRAGQAEDQLGMSHAQGSSGGLTSVC